MPAQDFCVVRVWDRGQRTTSKLLVVLSNTMHKIHCLFHMLDKDSDCGKWDIGIICEPPAVTRGLAESARQLGNNI